MKRVNVNVGYLQVFITRNNAGTKINAGANAKNWLIKVYVIKGLFRIHVSANVNMINCVKLVSVWTVKVAGAEKKFKLVEECTEMNNEVNLAKITLAENGNKHKHNSCILYIVLFSITFAINVEISTWIDVEF